MKSSSKDVSGGAQQASFSPGHPGVRSFSPLPAPYAASRFGRGCWRALRPSPTAYPAEKLTNKTPRIIIIAILWKIFSFCSVEEQLRTRSKKIGSPCTVRRGHVISSPNNASAPEGSALFVMTANHLEVQKTLTMQDGLSQSPLS